MGATVTEARAVEAAVPPRPETVEARSPRSVWWALYRNHLRALRRAAIAWILALAGIGAGVVATFHERVSTPEEREALADMAGIPAFEALTGRFIAPETVEGFTLSRWGMFAILVAVWAMAASTRLLRGAEDGGHVEPLRAGVVTPRGLLGSAVAALATVYAVFAVAIGLGHSAAGMDPATSWATGAAMGLFGLVFASAGALASQVAGTRQQALGLVGAFLGLALGLRIVAAAGATPEWMWWTTPFGWIGYLHELDQARVAVLGSLTALVIVLLVAAFAFARRDLDGARFGSAGGAAADAGPVRSPEGLAARITGRRALSWGAAPVGLAVVFGLLSHDFADAIADMPTTVEWAARLGWVGIDTIEGTVAWTFSFVAMLLGVFAASQVAAIREEEASWRIEHLLVRPVGRTRWLAGRVAAAGVAAVLIAAAAALAAFLATGATGSGLSAGDATLAALNVLPVALMVLGVGVALFGLVPRMTAPLVYGFVVAAFLLDFVGGLLELPEAVLELSPFRQMAAVPAAELSVVPALIMVAVGLAGALIGVAAFSRRDLQEA